MSKIIKIISIFLVLSFSTSIFLYTGLFNDDLIYAQKSTKKKKQGIKIRRGPKTFRVDFREKSIHDFLKAMSAIISKNIIADDKVKGNITVISPKPILIERAFAYLTSVLAVKGYGVVVEDKLLRVIPLKDAVAKGRLIHIGKKTLSPLWIKENVVVTAILQIEHVEPPRLATILKKVTNPATQITEYKEVGMLILTGGALEVNRLLRIIIQVDIPIEEEIEEEEELIPGDIHIIRVNNMEATKLESTLRKISLPIDDEETRSKNKKSKKNKNKQNQSNRKRTKKIDIIAHKESNSLIFVGKKEKWEIVKNLIRKLDIDREQILLEVLVAEVREDTANQFGIEWRIQGQGFGQFNAGIAADAIRSSGSTDADLTASLSNAVNSIFGFSAGVLVDSRQTILAIINANINNENFVVLSAPQVVTLDNQEAEINVGEDVPVQTRSSTSTTDSNAPIVNQFDYRPVGVKLKFTPQINSDKEITLKLFQEVKSVLDTEDTTLNPTFTKRDISTNIRIKDRQTIVIGGLISTDRSRTSRKIPILGDIPLLGYLFKRTSTTIRRNNLMVFITPHIITNRRIADRVTRELKRNQLKRLQNGSE